ncbi:MAG: hypothetical protein U9N33_00515 [Campylobacterota bacterium]|nr:hypothetical protein [Campylobacterota bacterium]
MDSEILYALFGIAGLMTIVYFTFRTDTVHEFKAKQEKKDEIIDGYKKQLRVALVALKDDKKARIVKKNLMLKKFSDELSMNIFFDKNEIREIILGLSKE